MTTQELSGDDVKCDKCQSIFDCPNEPSLCWRNGKDSRWICGNCHAVHGNDAVSCLTEPDEKVISIMRKYFTDPEHDDFRWKYE